MKIQTTRFGEIEVSEDLIFHFERPLLGYEQLKDFTLVDQNEESPFKWLQSLEDKETAFPVTVPALFGIDYQFVIPEEEAKNLELVNAENLLTLNIVSIPNGSPQNTTVNLAGPVVINLDNKKSMQLILTDIKYPVKYRLFSNPIKKEVKPQEAVENTENKG